jgi:peptidoglycan lytic transglycosylase G
LKGLLTNHADLKEKVLIQIDMKKVPVLQRLSGKQKASLMIIFLIPLFLLEIIAYFSFPVETKSDKKVNIEIPRGVALTQIADQLYEKKLIADPEVFVFWAKYLGYEKKMRAGSFSIPQGMNDYQVVTFLTTVKENTVAITLLEGWDLTQIAKAFESKLNIPKEDFLLLCFDRAFIKALRLDVNNLEGYLLPDTYHFARGESAEDIVKFLVRQTLKIFESDSVAVKMANMKLSRHEVLTLASIVEGEALIDDERPVIASLYHNRLKKKMRLQADPTIQYIVDGPPKRLLNRDLEIDSPYNTYLYSGLPPGPINNPGKKSILATIFPAEKNYLYMVAKGNGRHTFTKSLRAHINAKKEFDKVRRRVARERRLKGN